MSGDIVGSGVDALELWTGATGRCAWAQGAAGDISTRATRRDRTQEEADRLGSVVARAAGSLLDSAKPLAGGEGFGLARTTVRLPLKTVDDLGRPEFSGPVARGDGDRSEAALMEEAMVAVRSRQDGTRPPEDEAEVAILSIGSLRLAFVPGEPFGSLERALEARTGLAELRVVGYANGAPGYIFSPEEELDGGYEVMSSPLTGEAWDRVVAAAAGLLSR